MARATYFDMCFISLQMFCCKLTMLEGFQAAGKAIYPKYYKKLREELRKVSFGHNAHPLLLAPKKYFTFRHHCIPSHYLHLTLAAGLTLIKSKSVGLLTFNSFFVCNCKKKDWYVWVDSSQFTSNQS